MKKRVLIVGGILIAVGIAGGAGWRYYSEHAGITANDDVAYVSKVSEIVGTTSGVTNRFAGVVEPQQTVEIEIESGRSVKEVYVEAGDVVKSGQLLFEYDLSSIEEDIQEAQLELDRLKNEAMSLTEQISTLEKEKKKASADNQLSYTIEIETNKMNLKQNEYNQKSKQAELEKLQNALGNTEVRSEIEGVIQKIDTSKMESDDGESMNYSYNSYDDDSSNAFITILSTGAYRVKGSINEQNIQNLYEGDSVIVYSRVDDTKMWRGVISTIDRDNSISSNSNSYYYYGMSSDTMTSSSSYPFYVELEDAEELMLGQHVYIEEDNGQTEQKTGLWLSEFYIADLYEEHPYVWAVDAQGRLEKREVVLGEYDANLAEYEILEGLALTDSIAFPSEELEEGMKTADSSTRPETDEDYSSYDGDFDTSDMMDYMDDESFVDEDFDPDEYMDDESFMDEDFDPDEYMDDESFMDEDFDPDEYMDDESFMDEDFDLDEFMDDEIFVDEGDGEESMDDEAFFDDEMEELE